MNAAKTPYTITRRLFLQAGAAFSLGGAAWTQSSRPAFRFGVVTDSHYADIEPRGTRYYRQSLDKMAECVGRMNQAKVDFLVELGDLKDENTPSNEQETLGFLEAIEQQLAGFAGPRYYVLGNHDLDSIGKDQFWSRVDLTADRDDKSFYSFNHKEMHFVVLDANFRSDGAPYDRGNFNWTDANISTDQLQWLEQDLAQSPYPAIVFVHQLLDGEGDVYINNAQAVRAVLEQSGKVAAVMNGHHHAGQYNRIGGIHYVTHIAMVEGSGQANSAYSIVEVRENGDLLITGYRRAQDYSLP